MLSAVSLVACLGEILSEEITVLPGQMRDTRPCRMANVQDGNNQLVIVLSRYKQSEVVRSARSTEERFRDRLLSCIKCNKLSIWVESCC